MKKARRAHEAQIKGTYEKKSADELARVNLQMATQLQTQRLANVGQLAATKEQGKATITAATTRAKATTGSMAMQVDESRRQFDVGAPLRGEELVQAGLQTQRGRLETLYSPEVLEQLAEAGRPRKKRKFFSAVEQMMAIPGVE
jgi:hypothetical protein